MRCVWQVERDDYARRVLAKHWPDVRRHDDVCTFPPTPTAGAFGAPHQRDRIFIVAYAALHERWPVGAGRCRMDYCDDGIQERSKNSGRYRIVCEAVPATNSNSVNAQARIYGASGKMALVPRTCWGTDQPGLDRTLARVPNRLDRCNGLGNAVVPQVAEWIGRRIMESIE
jgi:DNA (cytosine-5)-methyltransferase 1